MGRITRDLGIDQTSDINLDDVAEVIPDIANPTHVTDSDTNIVFKLVEDLPVNCDEIRELNTEGNLFVHPASVSRERQLQKEIELIKEENDANAVKVEADGKFRFDASCTCSFIPFKNMPVTMQQLFLYFQR